MIIQVKNKFVNANKVLQVSHATSEKNGKSYLILEMDAAEPKQQKLFFEVADEAEFTKELENIKNQLNK